GELGGQSCRPERFRRRLAHVGDLRHLPGVRAQFLSGTLWPVKMYADRLPTAIRQLLTDILVVIWVYAWIRAGLWIHDTVLKLGVPGQKLEGAGTGLADNLADAGGKVGRVPLVGDQLAQAFTRAADAARSL